MTLLPLDQIRLDARSHRSALRWVGVLYSRPNRVKISGEDFSSSEQIAIYLRIYLHLLPYIAILGGLGRWLLLGHLEVRVFVIGIFICLTFGVALCLGRGLVVGLSFGLAVSIAASFALGSTFHPSFSSAVGLSYGLALGLAFSVISGSGRFWSPTRDFLFRPVLGILAGLGTLFAGAATGFLTRGYSVGLVFALTAGISYIFAFLRLYYIPLHLFFAQAPRARVRLYRFHPVAWDDLCFLPFPGLDRILVFYAEHDTKAGEREIDRLIDEYPSQRAAALRARAVLVARRAAAAADLSRLDEILASLPEGARGFLKETPELRRRVHEITALQARLDTLDRPFLREPFATLLVKEIEVFEQQVAGFKPPLSTELRKAARKWIVLARRQLDAARAAATREPTSQVFRAGDPVDREREAFVPRDALLSELERQVMLATGCPGLLVYGRRRMGKSTLLRNLEGWLPPRVLMVSLSMQEARAFASLSDLVALISQRIAAVLPNAGELPADLKGFEKFLGTTQKRLDSEDRRLLLAIDEYENLDRKIGEGILSEDLLAVIRESIQTHRRLIWAFAGSHSIDELVHAPWTSYLVSARTIEVTPFEPAETRLLLTEPLKHSSLWRASGSEPPRFEPGFWGEGGIERIHREARGWPHLVQLIAGTVVDLVNEAGGASVDGALLERALDRAVVRGNNVFLELLERESRLPGEWDYLRRFRRVEEQPVPDDEALDRSLRRRRLVVEEDGQYRLRVPLMGRWLRERV